MQYQSPEIYHIVQQLSKEAKLKTVPNIYYIPTNALNAFAVGTGNDTAIGVTSGLFHRLSYRELYGVIAHEISHIKNGDVSLKMLTAFMNRMTRALAFAGNVLLLINLPLLMVGEVTFPWIGILLLMVAPLLANILELAISRTREFEADLAAVRLTKDAEGLMLALQKLDYINKGGIFSRFFPIRQSLKIPKWLLTHPSIEERIQRLKTLIPKRDSFKFPLNGFGKTSFWM